MNQTVSARHLVVAFARFLWYRDVNSAKETLLFMLPYIRDPGEYEQFLSFLGWQDCSTRKRGVTR